MNGTAERLLTALGFAMKAGRLAVGEFAADRALKSGRAKLVAVDAAASDNTKKQWRDACAFRGVPMAMVPELGAAIGKSGRMCAAVTDQGFANMILKALESAANGTTEAMINDK